MGRTKFGANYSLMTGSVSFCGDYCQGCLNPLGTPDHQMRIPTVQLPRVKMLLQFLVIPILLLSCLPISRSIQPICFLKPKAQFSFYPHPSLKFHPCSLWSSSFSFCLLRARSNVFTKSTTFKRRLGSFPPVRSFSGSASSTVSRSSYAVMDSDSGSNPLLEEFYFPPFDSILAKHVRPGIRALLKQLVSY